MKFTYLELYGWRNFASVKLNLHPRLTVITGANGSGKTTILNLLGQHFEPIPEFSAVPQYLNGKFMFRSDIRIEGGLIVDGIPESLAGMIRYSNGNEACRFFVPGQTGSTFSLFFMNSQEVRGCHISFLRPISRYSSVTGSVSEFSLSPQELFTELLATSEYQLFEVLKSQLLRCARRETSSTIDSEKANWFASYEELLRDALPREIEFRNLLVRQNELLVKTENGEFSFDGSSGGIGSVIFICWKIFLCSMIDSQEFVVTLDEPENHLHPAMQQSLVTALVRRFDNAQFIVGTHSPFVVNCWPDSAIYALRFGEGGISSQLLESSAIKSLTPDDILKEVLGLPFTMPLWAADKLESVMDRYSGQLMTPEIFQSLVSDLKNSGLSDLIPESLELITKPFETE
ncbi:MAG: AAA family ATPase [Candidatus Obscuribacterales bacterium]|jgi:predicted ATPase